ncbi:MAG: helix-turn-helix transcriptional regulator, partial [Armatimonadota bacterium]
MKLEEQFERLIKTLQLIEDEPGEWDVPRLELHFKVGRATIERDIRILRNWGTIEREKGYFSAKNLQFLPTRFTASEAIAIMIACSMIGKRISVPGSDALDSALRKIQSLLPDQV